MNEQIHLYIQQRRFAGIGDEHIQKELRDAGWKEEDIASAFGFESVISMPVAPPSGHKRRWLISVIMIVVLLLAVGIGYAVFML